MKNSKPGYCHTLLFYRRSMDRIWKMTLLLGLVIAMAGGCTTSKKVYFLGIENDVWLFTSAIIVFSISVFAFLTRYVAYVQAHTGYLKVVTPFLRFRISYKRIRSAHPVLMQQLFPLERSNWSQRSFLKPFYGKTTLVVELFGYPINTRLLKLFLPRQMFSPRSTGFIFMVADWMKLSTELDSLRGAWLQGQGTRSRIDR